MAEARFVITPLADHFRIILRVVSIYQERRRNVSSYPYACAIGSIMCAMVCSRFDLAYAGIRKSVSCQIRKGNTGCSEVDGQTSTRDCDDRLEKPRTLQGYADVDAVFGEDLISGDP